MMDKPMTLGRPIPRLAPFDPIHNHGDLAHQITHIRANEHAWGVKMPHLIEEVIKAWENAR